MGNPPSYLRCEYFVNPLAIDVAHPRFSWEMNDTRRGAKQSAYHIHVLSNGKTLWDTGKVASDESTHIEYAGAPLHSRMRCEWKVRTWDMAGEVSDWSQPATFEIAFFEKSDWAAEWIGSPIVGGPYTIPPVPYLRKHFSLPSPIASARLYVTALGLYECEINGQRVGENLFAPGRTEYTKRVPYHVYDVTKFINAGENVIGAMLGDGWYCGHLHSDPRQTFGDRPRLLAQLEILFSDGSRQVIVSDRTWQAGEGPIRSSDMLMGEDYDARLEIPGWSTTGGYAHTADAWRPVVSFPDPGIAIVAHRSPPVKRIQELHPIKPPTVSANRRRHIFDLGQNMVGWVRLKFRNAPPGKTIDLRYVEMLDKEGKPYTTALRTARATDHYTTKGGLEETFEPRFTFHGFRYVEVRDYPGGNPTVDDLVGIVIHSETPPTGEFECSDPMINQLQRNIVWSQKGNFLDIPTDCPQRDERLGWTGDAQVFIRTASFNMDVAGFFHKWVQDVADAQFEDGHIPSVVPHVKTLHHEGGPAWSDAAVICPWTVYLCYGDKQILKDHWQIMTRFVGWMETSYPDFIRPKPTAKWQGYGDWLSMNAETAPDLIGTAYFAYCAHLMARIAEVLGNADEHRHYSRLFEDVRTAWQKRFVTPTGLIACQTQTAYVLALHFNLLPENQRPIVVEALVRDIQKRGMHLSTGFVGTPYLNHVLTRFGRTDIAYALLNQKTFPGWLFPVTHGATTMWERWDGWTPEKGFHDAGMNSYNHYAYGAVGDWMYSTITGIDLDPSDPGYRKILLRPAPGGGLSHAKAKLRTMFGVVESGWKIAGDLLQINVIIPANTSATLILPVASIENVSESQRPIATVKEITFSGADQSGITLNLPAGQYVFEMPPSPPSK